VKDARVSEASGLVLSRVTNGVIWTHNDSGDSARIFALSKAGDTLAEIAVGGAAAQDWEDIATGPGPSGSGAYLYLADFGDNATNRADVQIYRLQEPVIDPAQTNVKMSVAAERMVVTYPGGPRDAETLLVDPKTGQLAIVTKGAGTSVFVIDAFAESTRTAAELVRIPKSRGGIDTAVGGDVAADASHILIKDYSTTAKLWVYSGSGPLWNAFNRLPCSVTVPTEPQGEAVGFAPDGSGFYTLSEGATQPIYFVPKKP
jgi:hypothetical protein